MFTRATPNSASVAYLIIQVSAIPFETAAIVSDDPLEFIYVDRVLETHVIMNPKLRGSVVVFRYMLRQGVRGWRCSGVALSDCLPLRCHTHMPVLSTVLGRVSALLSCVIAEDVKI